MTTVLIITLQIALPIILTIKSKLKWHIDQNLCFKCDVAVDESSIFLYQIQRVLLENIVLTITSLVNVLTTVQLITLPIALPIILTIKSKLKWHICISKFVLTIRCKNKI